MPDDDELSLEQKEQLRVFRWLAQIHKHSKAKLETRTWDLASRLGVWRIVQTGFPAELANEPLFVRIAEDFQKSLVNGDSDFLRAVAAAGNALEKGDFFEKLNIQTQALIVFEELRQELGYLPSDTQIQDRFEGILGVRPSDRRWLEARKALARVRQK